MNALGALNTFFHKYKPYFWLLVALGTGFGLRVYKLDAQSLWNDEGTSIALAALNPEAIIQGAARDIHPPLYYLLLHAWMPLAGQTEFAVRFLSVLAGVLTVAVTYRIARSLFDVEVATIAAFLSAFAAFQVYYSQETRMYIWVTLWSAISALALATLSRKRSWAVGLVYLAATLAALYTHYFAVTLVAFENLAFAAWWLIVDRKAPVAIRDLARWLAGQLVLGILFLPWYLYAGNQLASWPAISEPFDLPALLWRVLNVFSVGLALDAGSALPIAVAFGVLIVSGVQWTREVRENVGTVGLLAWLLVPIGAMYVVSLSRPAYNPKFLLLATPAFLILAARGLAYIHPGMFVHWRHAPAWHRPFRFLFFAVSAVAAVGFIPALQNYYDDPRYARDDYRGIVQAIDADARPGDGILVDAPGQIEVVRYYHRGEQSLFPLPAMRPVEPAQTRADVDKMLARVQRLYAIYWATDQSDPERVIESRLAERAFKASDEWHGNVRLAEYGVAPARRGQTQDVDARMGDGIVLAGYQLDQREFRAGDLLTLTLSWRALQTPAERYKVFVHLLDANDRVVAQRDGEPLADTRITTTWRAGERLDDNYGIRVGDDIAPGEYRVEIGMYRAADGTRLQIAAQTGAPVGDHLVLGTLIVH